MRVSLTPSLLWGAARVSLTPLSPYRTDTTPLPVAVCEGGYTLAGCVPLGFSLLEPTKAMAPAFGAIDTPWGNTRAVLYLGTICALDSRDSRRIAFL